MKTFKEFNEESRQSIDEKAGLIGAGLKALGKTKLIDIAKFGVGAEAVRRAAKFLGRKKGESDIEPQTPKKTKYKKYENPSDASIPGRYPDESLKDYNDRRNKGLQNQIDKS